ncbi:hypothetical protein D3C79_953280 [compost metagenome]
MHSDSSHSHLSLSILARVFHGLTDNLLNNIVFLGPSDGSAAESFFSALKPVSEPARHCQYADRCAHDGP